MTLTYSKMAAARLRANKRQYFSLILGIFLSIFLVTALFLAVYGIYLSFLEDRYEDLGYLDAVIWETPDFDREEIRELDLFDRIGRGCVTGMVTDLNLYVGHYDETGLSLLNLRPLEGRLPENPGEIALEKTAMDVLNVQWQLGETAELSITPLDGIAESRSFTVVGFLPERSTILQNTYVDTYSFPAIVTSQQEPAFSTGRLATGYVMQRKASVSQNTVLEAFMEASLFPNAYVLSITGQMLYFPSAGNIWDANMDLLRVTVLLGALTMGLILSCGVGISGAMEGILARRQEEIGVLRALGATRRQIRRMFGRENLLLALVVAPASMSLACLCVWVGSRLLPQRLVFGFRLWLLVPIGIFSAGVILLSGYLPLARASRLMPMSVIRDTAILRRSKGIRYQKEFIPAQLVSRRQIRFHPTRQLGASLLVGLMLLCSGLFAALSTQYLDVSAADDVGFILYYTGNQRYHCYVSQHLNPTMSDKHIAQLRSLPHVKDVVLRRSMQVTALMDQIPSYAAYSVFDIYPDRANNYAMLDDSTFQEAVSHLSQNEQSYYASTIAQQRENYRSFLKEHDIPGEAFALKLVTVALDDELLAAFRKQLSSGRINKDTIDQGKEVIVLAPEVWISIQDYGSSICYSRQEAQSGPRMKDSFLAAWNDSFTAGDPLPLMYLYQTEAEGEVTREDASVTIGAVISQWDGMQGNIQISSGDLAILTTEAGLKNMGLTPEGLTALYVKLDGQITPEETEALEGQISAIARRFSPYRVINRIAAYREQRQQTQQALLLLASMSVLFFAVAVGMILSSITRQLASEGRTIGMLRAVGADRKTILGCYSGRITVSVAGGMGISLAVELSFWLSLAQHDLSLSRTELGIFAALILTTLVMGPICFLACRSILNFRIREITDKSIIENIREL